MAFLGKSVGAWERGGEEKTYPHSVIASRCHLSPTS